MYTKTCIYGDRKRWSPLERVRGLRLCKAKKANKKTQALADLKEERGRDCCSGESVSGWYVKTAAFSEELDGRE